MKFQMRGFISLFLMLAFLGLTISGGVLVMPRHEDVSPTGRIVAHGHACRPAAYATPADLFTRRPENWPLDLENYGRSGRRWW